MINQLRIELVARKKLLKYIINLSAGWQVKLLLYILQVCIPADLTKLNPELGRVAKDQV